MSSMGGMLEVKDKLHIFLSGTESQLNADQRALLSDPSF